MPRTKLKLQTKKAFFVMSVLICFNLLLFAFFIKFAIKLQKQNISKHNQTMQINISVFDPVTEFFLNELSKDIKTVEIHNVNEYLSFISNVSFFKKNKLKTSDAVIVFDPNHKIKNYFSIEDNKFFDISQNFKYDQSELPQIINVNNFLNYGLNGSSKNLQSLLISLTYIMKKLDPSHENIYEEKFFKINTQIVDTFQQSRKTIAPTIDNAVNIVLIGSQASILLKDIDFLGAININTKTQDNKENKSYIGNLKNIINSGEIRCIINLSNVKLPLIKQLSKKKNVKYMQYDIYKNFSLQNYTNFVDIVSQCSKK